MKWYQPLSLGLVAALPLIAWSVLHGKTETKEEVVARHFEQHTGLSARDLMRIDKASENLRQHQATDEDWRVIETFSASPHLEFRVTAEQSITYARGTAYEARARAILRRLAEDPDGGTRMVALRSLKAMRDPEAPRLIDLAKHSTDPYVSAKIWDLDKPLRPTNRPSPR